MFKMGCSMARKILAKDSNNQASTSSSSSKKSKDKPQDNNGENRTPAGGANSKSGDELGDFSKLEDDPRIPLNVRQIFKITKSWKAIARTMSKTGTAMFLNLFEQNQDLFYLFDRFQHLKGTELHESMELREHAATVMSTLDQSINSLSDYDNFVRYLHSIGKLHRKVPGFKRAHFWKIEQPFMIAVKQTLDERCNETIEEIYKIAIKLIIETIADGYGEDDQVAATNSKGNDRSGADRPQGMPNALQDGNGNAKQGGSLNGSSGGTKNTMDNKQGVAGSAGGKQHLEEISQKNYVVVSSKVQTTSIPIAEATTITSEVSPPSLSNLIGLQGKMSTIHHGGRDNVIDVCETREQLSLASKGLKLKLEDGSNFEPLEREKGEVVAKTQRTVCPLLEVDHGKYSNSAIEKQTPESGLCVGGKNLEKEQSLKATLFVLKELISMLSKGAIVAKGAKGAKESRSQLPDELKKELIKQEATTIEAELIRTASSGTDSRASSTSSLSATSVSQGDNDKWCVERQGVLRPSEGLTLNVDPLYGKNNGHAAPRAHSISSMNSCSSSHSEGSSFGSHDGSLRSVFNNNHLDDYRDNALIKGNSKTEKVVLRMKGEGRDLFQRISSDEKGNHYSLENSNGLQTPKSLNRAEKIRQHCRTPTSMLSMLLRGRSLRASRISSSSGRNDIIGARVGDKGSPTIGYAHANKDTTQTNVTRHNDPSVGENASSGARCPFDERSKSSSDEMTSGTASATKQPSTSRKTGGQQPIVSSIMNRNMDLMSIELANEQQKTICNNERLRIEANSEIIEQTTTITTNVRFGPVCTVEKAARCSPLKPNDHLDDKKEIKQTTSLSGNEKCANNNLANINLEKMMGVPLPSHTNRMTTRLPSSPKQNANDGIKLKAQLSVDPSDLLELIKMLMFSLTQRGKLEM